MTNPRITEEMLHAFIDGELDPSETQRVAAIVDASPELSAEVDRFRADKELLHRIYAPLADLPLPARLTAPLGRAGLGWRFPRLDIGFGRLPAGILAAVVLLVAGWFALPELMGLGGDPLIAEAFDAQDGRLRTEQNLGPADAAAAQDRIAEATLAKPVKVPGLEKAGYRLKGIAVFDVTGTERAVQARYESKTGHAFVVYIRHSLGADRFELHHRGKTQVCVWQNDDVSVVMTGDMSAREMLKVANLTYTDLNF